MNYDLCGAIVSLLSTYYFVRRDIKAWPMGLLATCLNGWLYFKNSIYADSCLELFYFISLCYGWYRWSILRRHHTVDRLIQLSYQQHVSMLFVISILYLIILNLLSLFSHSTVTELDALTASLSLVAQWLMCHKIISTWTLWFITDGLFAIIYLQKNLPFHALLMLIYMGMAIIGHLSWTKQHRIRLADQLQTGQGAYPRA